MHKTQRIERLQTRIARLEAQERAEGARWDELSRFFHLGTVGGSGRNARRLDRQRGSSIGRKIDRLKELDRLRAALFRLEYIAPARAVEPKVERKTRQKRAVRPVTGREFQIYEWHHFGLDVPPPFDGVTAADVIVLDRASYEAAHAQHGPSIYERMVLGEVSPPARAQQSGPRERRRFDFH